MGLDMYLTEEIYVAEKYEHRKIAGQLSITEDGKELCAGISNLSSIRYERAYWRKANQIHKWFVDNVQDGKDECEEVYVSIEQLKALDELCEKVLLDREQAATLLPVSEGFFFGSNAYDDYYFEDIEATRKQLKPLFEGELKGTLYYRSSW